MIAVCDACDIRTRVFAVDGPTAWAVATARAARAAEQLWEADRLRVIFAEGMPA